MKGAYRSRSLRRVKRKSPTKTSMRYKRRKPKKPRCENCKRPLSRPRITRNKAKSRKVPNRPYPNLCSPCMREKILNELK